MGEGARVLADVEPCPRCKGERGHYRRSAPGGRIEWEVCPRCRGTAQVPVPGLEKVEGDLSAFTVDVVDRMMQTHQRLAPEAFAFRRERMIALLDAALAFADCGDDRTLAPNARRAAVREVVRAAEDWANAKKGRRTSRGDDR